MTSGLSSKFVKFCVEPTYRINLPGRKHLERERQVMMSEKDRLHASLRGSENDLHAMQLNLSSVKTQLVRTSQVKARSGEMEQELAQINTTLGVMSARLWRQNKTKSSFCRT